MKEEKDFLHTEAFAWCKGKQEEYDEYSHKLDWCDSKAFEITFIALIVICIIGYVLTH